MSDLSGKIVDNPKKAVKKKPSKKKAKQIQDSTKVGLSPGWTRTTIVIRDEHLEKLKSFAFLFSSPLKDTLDKILTDFFSNRKIDHLEKKKMELIEELDIFFKKDKV